VDTLLHVGLSNAVAASALAALAGIVGYFCRRPALRHALWLLVLLKLVTPPLVDVPVWRPAEPAPREEPVSAPAEEALVLAPDADPPPAADDPVVVLDLADAEPAAAPAEPAEPPAAAPVEGPVSALMPGWRQLAGAVWVGGTVLWVVLAAFRAARFARTLRHAEPAPAWLQREADDLAARLGLDRAPVVRLLPGRVSPMLWGPGLTARLLLPAQLLGRLDADGRRTLLVHELAHLLRRDHRVRLLELLVTALFWWHPVVWWARRELREAEEQCCDAWVLWALPASARTYALALVETVDFLSETRSALPALASGVGHVDDLRRRVTMIMQGTTPRALTWRGVMGLLGLGIFLLPVMPSWAQEDQPIRVQVSPDAEYKGVIRLVAEAQDLQQLKAELEKKRAELAALEAKLKAAQAKLEKGPAGGDKEKPKQIILELVDGDSRQVIRLPAGSRVTGEQLGASQAELYKSRIKLAQDALEKAKVAAGANRAARGLVIEIISDGKRQVIELPPGSRVLSSDEAPKRATNVLVVPKPAPGQPVQPPKASPPYQIQWGVVPRGGTDEKGIILRPAEAKAGDTEARLAELEKKLEEVMRGVKELHGQLHKANPGGSDIRGIQFVPKTPPPGAPPAPPKGPQPPGLAPPQPNAPLVPKVPATLDDR
jgi:beta-lactamase regulating signal transducer with metallopeptidase domain